MKFDPSKHRRRSIRLKDFDYTTPGAYFITICTFQRECLLGEISDGIVVMNGCGEIARDEWFKTIQIRTNIQLHGDEFVVMPNHLHGIIWIIEPDVRVTGPVPPTCRFSKMAVSNGGLSTNSVEALDLFANGREWSFPGAENIDGTIEGAMKAGLAAYP